MIYNGQGVYFPIVQMLLFLFIFLNFSKPLSICMVTINSNVNYDNGVHSSVFIELAAGLLMVMGGLMYSLSS